MTVNGTIVKSALMLLLILLTAGWTWNRYFESGAASVTPWMMGGLFGGFVVALIMPVGLFGSLLILGPAIRTVVSNVLNNIF